MSDVISRMIGASNHTDHDRVPHDYYATDPKAVEMLLELEQFAPVIWEPACGEGHISKVLQAHGHEVISTDLIYRGFGDPEPLDFLKETLDGFDGDIITNPPYSLAQDFVQTAIDTVKLGRKVAMFLKIQFLEGKKRFALFEKSPPEPSMFPDPVLDVGRTETLTGTKTEAPFVMPGSFGKKASPGIP